LDCRKRRQTCAKKQEPTESPRLTDGLRKTSLHSNLPSGSLTAWLQDQRARVWARKSEATVPTMWIQTQALEGDDVALAQDMRNFFNGSERLTLRDLRRFANVHLLKVKDSHHSGCRDDATIVGFVAWSSHRSIAGCTVASSVELDALSVRHSYRKLGFGKRLLQHALKCIRREGASWIGLHVRRDNWAAQSLYTKFGFRRCEQVGVLSQRPADAQTYRFHLVLS